MRVSNPIRHRSDILCIRVLGTQARYRVRHEAGPIVQVEVIDVPGLASGTQLYLTRSAVAHMRPAPVLAAPRRRSHRVHLATRVA